MHDVSRRDAVGLVLLTVASPFAAAIPSSAADDAPLAIKGFDPVAYFTDAKPVPGRPEIEFEWDESRYRFASAQHRALFKADPGRYAPQFANFCAMALAKGELIVANPKYWLVSDGKLYIFGKPEGPDLFRQDLSSHIDKANQNRPLITKR
jgi:hypothetical protein